MPLFSYKHMHDNIIPEDKFMCKESDKFPIHWFEKYPAEQGGDGIITHRGLQVMSNETLDFLEIHLRWNESVNPSKERKRKAITAFFDALYGD